jgi:hypothetical protein
VAPWSSPAVARADLQAAGPPAAAPAARAAPPPVVIDRIEIVTPPAQPPPADPLAAVGALRAGRSRHGAPR